jgi:hypothetical protein
MQRAFQKNTTCADLASLFQAVLNHTHRHKKQLYAIMIDFKDAYGSLSHIQFFKILKLMNIPEQILDVIKEFFTGHHFKILTDSGLSDSVECKKGVPQGDPLSPLMFIIYQEVLYRYLNKLDEHIDFSFKYNEKNTKFNIPYCAYADDGVLFAKNARLFNLAFGKFRELAEILGLEINPQKSLTITRRKNGEIKRLNPLLIKNIPVPEANNYWRYLGYWLSRSNASGPNAKELWKNIKQKLKNLNVRLIRPLHFTTIIQSVVHGSLRFSAGLGHVTEQVLKAINAKIQRFVRYNLFSRYNSKKHYLYISKNFGGTGIKDAKTIALSAYANQLIKLLNSPLETCRQINACELVHYINSAKRSHAARNPFSRMLYYLNANNVYLAKYDCMESLKKINTTPPLPNTNAATLHKFTIRSPNVENTKELVVHVDACYWEDSGESSGAIIWTDKWNNILDTSAYAIPKMSSSTRAESYNVATTVLLCPPNSKVEVWLDNRGTTTM